MSIESARRLLEQTRHFDAAAARYYRGDLPANGLLVYVDEITDFPPNPKWVSALSVLLLHISGRSDEWQSVTDRFEYLGREIPEVVESRLWTLLDDALAELFENHIACFPPCGLIDAVDDRIPGVRDRDEALSTSVTTANALVPDGKTGRVFDKWLNHPADAYRSANLVASAFEFIMNDIVRPPLYEHPDFVQAACNSDLIRQHFERARPLLRETLGAKLYERLASVLGVDP